MKPDRVKKAQSLQNHEHFPDGFITEDNCVVQATTMCMYDCANATCSTRFGGKTRISS